MKCKLSDGAQRTQSLLFRCLAGMAAALTLTVQGAAAAPGSLLIQWNEQAQAEAPATRQQRLSAALADSPRGAKLGDALSGLGGRWQRVHMADDTSAEDRAALLARLRADPRIRAAVADVREQRQDVRPNDVRYAEQWWLQAVAAGSTGVAGFTRAWDRSTGAPAVGAGAVVAVLDSGITSHPELNARLLPGWDFVSDATYSRDGNGRDNDPSDPGDAITAAERTANPAAYSGCPAAPVSSWHGTTIAGQLGAVSNNVEGVAAGNWFGRVVPVRVAGQCGAALSDIIDGMRWAAGLPVAGVLANPNPARVVVLSYGGIDACDANSTNPQVADTARLYQAAIAELRQAGVLFVVAAGNQRSSVGRPASCPGAFGVTALNREGYKASYANFGTGLSLATPGGDAGVGGTCDAQLADTGIVSTGNLGSINPGQAGYAAATGTSFAAPAVAAVATLMLAVAPSLTLAQLEDGLKRSARPFVRVPLLGDCALADNRGRCACTTATCGAGMLDADEALRFAAAPASYTPTLAAAPVLADSRLETCAALLGRVPPEPPVAPPVTPPTTPTVEATGGGGGGSSSLAFMLGLSLAVLLLSCDTRRRPSGGDHREKTKKARTG